MNQALTAKAKSKKGLYILLVVAALLLLSCLSPIGWFIFQIHRNVKQSIVEADSGFRRATNTIDPKKLRAWALEEITNYKPSNNDSFGKEIPNSEIPNYIQDLYSDPPEDALIHYDGYQSYVSIIWGGGFFHWGFYVGSTNEIMPFISDNTEYPYNFEWKPGIYYTREAKWKLQ